MLRGGSAGDEDQPSDALTAAAWGAGLSDRPATVTGDEINLPDLYAKLEPSVFTLMAGNSYEEVLKQTGSGRLGSAVAVSRRYMVTADHVIAQAKAIVAYGKHGFVRVVVHKRDPETDRCILEVADSRDLLPIPGVRSLSDLRVGERVFTIGSPQGVEGSLGEGVISGLRGEREHALIQTTAQVSPGSSGGGLFDARGNLVGITVLKHRTAESLNFAIPASAYWQR